MSISHRVIRDNYTICAHRGIRLINIERSEISYTFGRNPFEKREISYAKCLSDLPLGALSIEKETYGICATPNHDLNRIASRV